MDETTHNRLDHTGCFTTVYFEPETWTQHGLDATTATTIDTASTEGAVDGDEFLLTYGNGKWQLYVNGSYVRSGEFAPGQNSIKLADFLSSESIPEYQTKTAERRRVRKNEIVRVYRTKYPPGVRRPDPAKLAKAHNARHSG